MKKLTVCLWAALLFQVALVAHVNAQDFDFGDEPEGVIAYPSTGIMGSFPTCMNVLISGWIQHGWGPPPWVFFGSMVDIESEGNAGLCPSFGYDADECFNDPDAGLILPTGFTIDPMINIVPCPNATLPTTSLGTVCTTAMWGANVDIFIQETMGIEAIVNVLMDWDQSGSWGGSVTCPGGLTVPEHVLINFPVPPNFNGPLSILTPPPFTIGTNSEFVWSRFTITYFPVPLPWDGSGVFEDGETEDYLLHILPGSSPTNTPVPTHTPEPSPTPSPTDPIEEWRDFGDAPENALAYPSVGTIGMFPTCRYSGPSGWIEHLFGNMFFGWGWDAELDGNAGSCPNFSGLYDQDECMNDIDAGLMIPGVFTITGAPGSEIVVPCPLSGGMGIPLGMPCQTVNWGMEVDIHIQNNAPVPGFVNVLFDWNQSGGWGGFSDCGGLAAPEQVLVDFFVPAGWNGPISALGPPPFLVGPNDGFVWARFTISDGMTGPGWDGSGVFIEGETEDYLVFIDNPYPPTATPTTEPTNTPVPTDTPFPTNTPIPTDTPTSIVPTSTPTGVIPTDTPTAPQIPATGPGGVVFMLVILTLILVILPGELFRL